jgi:hypothetical protein
MCQSSAGATVKHQPKSVSWISRNSVKYQVTPEREASPEARQFLVPPGGIEPPTHGLGNGIHAPLRLMRRLEAGANPRRDPAPPGDF